MNTLPSEYQRVEYIQSSGTQYIDTLITPTINTKSVIKFINLEYTGYSIFGFYNNNDNQDYRIFNENSNYKTYFDIGNNRSISGSNTLNSNEIYELEIGNNYVKNLGTNQYIVNGSTVSSFTANGTLTLNGNSNFSKNKRYYAKIWESGSMVRNLIPCYRKSDGVIGMYDLVEGTFYTNAGSGTFTKGPDVKGFKVKKVYIGTKLVRPKPKTEDVVLLSSGGAINKYSESTYNYYSNCIRNQNTYWDAYVESTDQSGIRYFQFTDEIVGFKISMAAANQNNYGAIECMLSPDGNVSSSSRKRFVNGIRTITSSKDYQGSNTGHTGVSTVANEVRIDGSSISKSSATATATIQGILENNKRTITMSNSSGETGSHEFDYSTPLYYIGRMPYGRSTGVMGYAYTAEVTLKK